MSVLINLLHSTAEDYQPGTPTYTEMVNEHFVTPDKEDAISEDSHKAVEEIALSPIDIEVEEEFEQTAGKSKPELVENSDFLNEQFPTDPNYLRLLLDYLNVML